MPTLQSVPVVNEFPDVFPDELSGLPPKREIDFSIDVLPVRTTYSAEDYARLYIKEIVRLHGVPVSIISDRGAQFTANFWRSFQEGLGTQWRHEIRRVKGKLSPRYIGPYQIVRKVGKVAYELNLPADLEAVHPVFHVSMLRKFIGDPSRVFPVEDIQVTEELSYEEQPVAILDRQVRRLRTKDVPSVKVLWRNNNREEMTWEAEEEMKKKYPHLFPAPPVKKNGIDKKTLIDDIGSYTVY
ncbi:uncharacterized protein LOC132041873, partial [Lycium ferocissimum]|uniref:uncharacterized protein LOC132041873 n=1 Tax=Lycium ferocissimum TaxID=112874 RepID=UPI002815A7A3